MKQLNLLYAEVKLGTQKSFLQLIGFTITKFLKEPKLEKICPTVLS
jgi:hypothetical protein